MVNFNHDDTDDALSLVIGEEMILSSPKNNYFSFCRQSYITAMSLNGASQRCSILVP